MLTLRYKTNRPTCTGKPKRFADATTRKNINHSWPLFTAPLQSRKKTPIPQKLKREQTQMTQLLGCLARPLMKGGPAVQPVQGTNDLNLQMESPRILNRWTPWSPLHPENKIKPIWLTRETMLRGPGKQQIVPPGHRIFLSPTLHVKRQMFNNKTRSENALECYQNFLCNWNKYITSSDQNGHQPWKN